MLTELGRLDGIAMVGLTFGQLVCAAGEVETGLQILERSRAGFEKLRQPDMVQQTEKVIRTLQEKFGKPT